MAGHDHTPDLHEHSDQWHHHAATEGSPQHEHAAIANPAVLFHWFLLITASMVAVIVALGMYFGKYYSTTRQEKIETLDFYNRPEGPRERLAQAEASLWPDKPVAQYTYHAANTQTHTVQLPIEQAMAKVLAKYQSAKTAQAPVPTEQTKQQ
jgi:hypothetical protein